jgi:monoterpene epsilon-lactone hydrolase
MSEPPAIARHIERVKAVLGSWGRGTPIEQMRRDWDELYTAAPGTASPAKEEAFAIDGVPATWITAPGARAERVLLYLHGGGFSLGSVRSHRELLVRLSQAARCRVLALEYRRVPEHRYPAALEDSVRAYDWLLANGVRHEQCSLAGDSAGGGLVLSTMLTARDRGRPLPASAVLLSAFTDLTTSRESYSTRAAVDPWHEKLNLEIVARAYLRGANARDPQASPLFADLRGLPPLLVQVGDHEVVLDDSRDLATAARAAGVEVTLEVYERMIHVFQQFAADVPEAEKAVATIGTFLDRHWNQAR